MTTFVLSPTSAFTAASPYRSPRVMLEQDLLAAYTQRDNGTLRHLELAPLGSPRRDTAEWVSEQVGDGMAVKAIAREMHVSVATVRRYLLSLELTEQIEADEWEDLGFDAEGEPVWVAMPVTEEDLHDEECTCAAEVLGNNWHTQGCALAPSAVLGDHCEPEGTTAEELEGALAASVSAVTYTLAGPGGHAMNNPH